jgi:hypothetical protein
VRPTAPPQPDLPRVTEVERPPGSDHRHHQQHLEDPIVDAREIEREADIREPVRDPRAGDGGDDEQEEDQPEKLEGAHRGAV